MDQVASLQPALSKVRGFSIMELLAVIAIILIIGTLAGPAISSVARGSSLNRAGQIVGDQFSLARQKAVTLNRDIEVRFYKSDTDGESLWRAIQFFQIDQTSTGPITKPCSRILHLPTGVAMMEHDDLSPLVTSSPLSGTSTIGSLGQVSYRAFRFRANGSIEAGGAGKNYVTLANVTDKATPPHNFYTLQINPVTGKVSAFRP